MAFGDRWYGLLDECEDLPEGATLITPLSQERFQVTDVQEHRIVVEFPDRDMDETRPLQREQFETLHRRIADTDDGFDLSRLPPDADPYPAVLSLHPRIEVDEEDGLIREAEPPTDTQRLSAAAAQGDDEASESDRSEPEVAVYGDALLLVDALERHDLDSLESLETPTLVNLYTLLSDIQRDADDLRQQVSDVLLERFDGDEPAHGQFGSVQPTTRRRRDLKDDEAVLAALEAEGVDREQVLGVDREKVDDALAVTDLSEADVYELEETEYVRKAEINEEQRESRLQGLKDRLATSDDAEADQLRAEIEELEARIEELTEFKSATSFHTPSGGEP